MPELKMKDIKRADTGSCGIKTKDLYVNPGRHMKAAYIKTKNLADRQLNTRENNPEEYAADTFTGYTEGGVERAAYGLERQGRRAIRETAGNIKTAKQEYSKSKTEKKIRKESQSRQQTELKSAANSENSTPQAAGGRSIGNTMSSHAYGQSGSKAAKNARRNSEKSGRALLVRKRRIKKTEENVKAAAKAAARTVRTVAAALKAMVSAIIAGGWISVIVLIIVVIFGAVLAVFSTSGGAASPVSEEVNAYTPLITVYAKKHGVPEYVDLIKAVMMQESGGRGNDPMQASECGFNTRYPKAPNGITDPEYSIDVGVQNIAAVLKLAEVQSPIDIPNISLALQGYNFGNGYIAWAKGRGGYTPENAMEFSQKMAVIMGWSNYGDAEYVPHVLRYYPLGGILPDMGSGSLAQVALSQLGNVGGQAYWSWYGYNYRVEWCACFVSWCGAQCGYTAAELMPTFSYCPEGVQWYKDMGRWQDRSYNPNPGDIIFFDWEGDGIADHVGIVEYSDGSIIHTIEGNVGDRVVQQSYSMGYLSVLGYALSK